MPALPNKTSRRRGVTPITNFHREDVWQRTLDMMGMAPLDAPASDPSTTVLPTSDSPTSSDTKRKLSILDLPQETQKDIFKHASITDLVALSLVSKHFRDIAAERLYRSFHIIFPDEDHPSHDLQIDDLASGLDTFVTSDYDYSQYLREIVLETLSGGDRGEKTYRHYLYDSSCGKFMNTLLLLTLRKAKSLETFKWDIRVELSRDVFKALHNIASLQHLHLRMQAGSSIYRAPTTFAPYSVLSSMMDHSITILPHPPPPVFGTASPPPSFPSIYTPSSASKTSTNWMSPKNVLPPIKSKPPTMSGFENLKTLAVLDMDTLEYIPELRTCISNCASTLTSLELSFSDYLSSKSKKPPVEVPSDDETDQEDEFGQILPPPLPSTSLIDTNAPSKAITAQEEKKEQEAALARIFDLEHPIIKSPTVQTPDLGKVETPREVDPKRMFVKSLTQIANKLMKAIEPGANFQNDGQDALEAIAHAAKIYLQDSGNSSKPAENGEPASSVDKTEPAKETTVESTEAVDEEGPSLFDVPERPRKKSTAGVSDPDDIDIEEPEGQELDAEVTQDSTDQSSDLGFDAKVSPNEAGPSNSDPHVELQSAVTSMVSLISTITAETAACAQSTETPPDVDLPSERRAELVESLQEKGNQLKPLANNDAPEYKTYFRQYDKYLSKLKSGKRLTQADALTLEAAVNRVVKSSKRSSGSHQLSLNTKELDSSKGGDSKRREELKMADYIRKTRGLRLEHLSIYLIPIKASILSKAIDLYTLKSMTLLSVGSQVSFWNMLHKENKTAPLPLCKIYTDHVTPTFCLCASALSTIKELYLLERTQKNRGEGTPLKSVVTMENIRKIILKAHIGTLKVLMIRNDAGHEWDLNVKATLLLCRRAKNLEELAVSFGIKTMHALLQSMPGLTKLRALHTIQFRTEDTCLWVMREFRKFTLDNIAHNPEMKLQWLALDQSVEALVRRVKSTSKSNKKADKKGKGKASDPDIPTLAANFLVNPSPTESSIAGSATASAGADWELNSSDDDEDYSRGKAGLKIDSIENINFQDISGVKIFEKTVIGGRL